MKRIIVSKRHRRRGSLFHYYMMYLLLTSVLLISAGLCIHSVLKADRVDAAESRHMNALLALDESLRNDAADWADVTVAELELSFTSSEAQITWSVNSFVLTREERRGEELYSSNRFLLRKGSKPVFSEDAATGRITLTVTDPPRLPSVDGPSTVAQTVEIHLTRTPFAALAKDGAAEEGENE